MVLERPVKTLAEVFGNAAGLGSQPLRWRRSITQTDREVSFGLCRRRDRDLRPTTLTLTIGRGQRERDHHPTSLTLTIEGERGLTLTKKATDKERLPNSHPATFI